MVESKNDKIVNETKEEESYAFFWSWPDFWICERFLFRQPHLHLKFKTQIRKLKSENEKKMN